jgi:predicted Ser/Thr protein kinase
MHDDEFISLQEALAGEYSLERELGRGGMGIVYLAREVQLDRLVAIKLLPSALAQRADVKERFLREARMAASLSHPHIVPIYRVGEAKGLVFFVMAYVSGETLGERLRTRGPLPTAVASRLFREVTWALSYAHGRGIVHRDVKPDNILIEADTGRALVTDFGIARGAEQTEITDPGRVMGTAHFMSPEQGACEPVDGRSDFYSLGVVAYLAVSGKLPFDAPSVPALLAKHAAASVPALTRVAPSIPASLASVIERCLRKNPDERWGSGEELVEAFEAASAPIRAKLPMALRVWAQSDDPMKPAYVAWYWMFTLQFVLIRRPTDLAWTSALVVPMIPMAIYQARKTYKALSAGYGLRDLKAALAAWQDERREEILFDASSEEPRWAKWMRRSTYVLSIGALAAFRRVMFVMGIREAVLLGGLGLSALVMFTGSNALGVRLMSPKFRARLVGAARSAILNSRFGEWAVKMLTPKKRTGAAELDYRPTEMALGMAVGELYAALPKPYRDDLSDLPAVVERLESHAAAARARVDELNAVLVVGGSEKPTKESESLIAARDAAKRELGDSVAALEAVRLDLLRLHGGAVDLRPITTVLEAARELGEQLDRLDQANRTVAESVRPISLDLRPHTPT